MQQIQTLLNNIPLGCKLLYILSFVVFIVGLFVTNFTLLLANITYLTYANNQYWRLFSSVLSPGISLFSFIGLIIDFCLIRFFFAKLEKKYSTIFFLTQIIIQNLLVQLTFTVLSIILIEIGLVILSGYISYGWAPLIIIFTFKIVHQTQEQNIKILCFDVPKKHLPLVIVLISFIFGYSQFLCLLISVALGFFQFKYLKKHLIRLPLGYYKFWDKIIPKFIKQRQDYIEVQFTEEVLKQECSKLSLQRIKAFFKISNKKRKEQKQQNEQNSNYSVKNHNSLNEQILEDKHEKNIYEPNNNMKISNKNEDDRSTIDSKKVDCDQIYL